MNWHDVFQASMVDATKDDLTLLNGAEEFARFAADNTLWRDMTSLIEARIQALLGDLETTSSEITPEGQIYVPTVADFAHIQGQIVAWRSILALPLTVAQTLFAERQEQENGRREE